MEREGGKEKICKKTNEKEEKKEREKGGQLKRRRESMETNKE